MSDTASSSQTRRRAALALAAAAALVFASVGCSPPDDGDAGVDPPPADTGNDTSTPVDADDTGVDEEEDAGDTDEEADSVGPDSSSTGGDADAVGGDANPCGGCPDGKTCHEGTCKPSAEVKCMGATDKGTLSEGSPLSISGSFENYDDDSMKASCAASEDAPERLYKFKVPEDSVVDMTTSTSGAGGFGMKVEFRRGGCTGVSQEKTVCYDQDRAFWAGKGETIYMLVEHDVGPAGSFQIDLEATPAACKPNSFACTSEGNRQDCQVQGGSPTPVEYQCPSTGCNNGVCVGDTCSAPIMIDSTGTHTFKGDTRGFTNAMNFKGNQKCKTGGAAIDSAGRELVFAVKLNKGQTLTIDASADSLDNLVYIGTACKKASNWDCTATSDVDVDKEAGYSFTAPATGTFPVVIDAWSSTTSPRSFDYEITVN